MDAGSDGLTLRGVVAAIGVGVLLIGLFAAISLLGGSKPDPAQASPSPTTPASSPATERSFAATTPTTPMTPTTTTPLATPAATTPEPTTPEPAPRAGASSASPVEAQANARVALSAIEACFIETSDYTRCTTADQLGPARLVIVADPPGPGEVAITSTARGYLVRAADAQGQLWGIRRRAGTIELQRTCHLADGVTPCANSAW